MENNTGARVVLTTADDQVFKGILFSVDNNAGKIALKKVFVNDTRLPGLQYFYASNIKDLVLKDSVEDLEDGTNKLSDGKRKLRKHRLHKKDRPRHLQNLQRFDHDQLIASSCHCAGDDTADQGIGSAEDSDVCEDFYETDNYVMFCRTCDKFRESITYLMKQDVIAVTFYGVEINRNGTLSLMQVATETDILIYDILRLGEEGFIDGLQAVLESRDVLKVVHDCRMVSDILCHQYRVVLSNVFDTQVAGVFVFRLSNHGDWPRFVDSLPTTLMSYLGLRNEDVHHFFVRERMKQKDEEVWLQRPICTQLLQDSLKNLVHMINLYRTLRENMMKPFDIGVQLYLDHFRKAPSYTADEYRTLSHLLPCVFQDIPKLTSYAVREHKKHKHYKAHYDSNGFVEICSSKNSKAIISRDSIWHKKNQSSEGSKCCSKSSSSGNTKSTVQDAEENTDIPGSSAKKEQSIQRSPDAKEVIDRLKGLQVSPQSDKEATSNLRVSPQSGNKSISDHQVSPSTSDLQVSPQSDSKPTPGPQLNSRQLGCFPAIERSALMRITLPSQSSPSSSSCSSEGAAGFELRDRLSQFESTGRTGQASFGEQSPFSSALQKSALFRLIPPAYSSASSTYSEVLSDPEIVDQRQGTASPVLDEEDVDKFLEFEVAQRIIKQARQGRSKSLTEKHLLPPKVKLNRPKSSRKC